MAESAPLGAAGDGALRGSRILVAEDEILIAMELECQLQDCGAEVVGPAMTLDEALASAANETLAAAILDLRLGRNSIDPVARILRRRGIPFVFYSGQMATDPERAKWPHITTVAKPAAARVLVKALAAAIDGRA